MMVKYDTDRYIIQHTELRSSEYGYQLQKVVRQSNIEYSIPKISTFL